MPKPFLPPLIDVKRKEREVADVCPSCMLPKDGRAEMCSRCRRWGPEWTSWIESDDKFVEFIHETGAVRERKWNNRNSSE